MNPTHKLTLDQARYWHRNGLMSEAEWRAYAHAWQTGAPRFGTHICQCPTCSEAARLDFRADLDADIVQSHAFKAGDTLSGCALCESTRADHADRGA